MSELEKKITEAAQAYYSTGKSELSDDEFDTLVDELRTTNPDSPILKQVGWGYDVEDDNTPGKKYPHKYGKAGSLEKCRTWDEIKSQFKHTVIDVSAKLDGLSVVLYYESGKLVQALTRGDGYIGIDITDKIRHIMGGTITDTSFIGGVRGEILMTNEAFEKFQKSHPEAKNPRNSAAGLINGKEITEDFKYLTVVTYSVVGGKIPNGFGAPPIVDIAFVRIWLANNFLHTAPHLSVLITRDAVNLDFKSLKEQWSEEYPIDGLVLTSRLVQSDGDKLIQDSIAFKFKSETARAKVLEVEWNMSKTGYAVPRVRIEPVQLAGTKVQYCTGYNAQYIKDNQLGVGSIVEVEKRGEIIPNINKIVAISGSYELPKFCPYCHSELKWNGVHLQCVNPNCRNTTVQDTMIWTNELAPVDGLAETLKEKLFINVFGEVPTVEKLMSSDASCDFVIISQGRIYGKTQLTKFYTMLKCLNTCENISLVTAIRALNIPRFGDVNAAKLAQYPDYVHELLNLSIDGSCADGLKAANLESELTYAVGKANTESLFANLDKITRLRFIESRIDWSVPTEDAELRGKVAITGKLSVKRADFEKELIAAGYTPADIAKDTKFLITDNPDSSSSKNKKANAWGIVKIRESEFREKYLK